MKSTSFKYIFGIFLLGFFSACQQNKGSLTDQDPTAFRTPITKAFEYTEAKPIEWEIIDPDSISPPQSYPLDIDKIPSQPFSINDFKPLKSPMEESPLDWDPKNRIPLEFDTVPIEMETSILPSPVVSRMNQPSVLSGTSSGILQLSMSEGLPSNEVRKVLQNDDGSYWIATFDGGLCLYNGNELYTYDYKRIWDIVLDRDGKLWVATGTNGVYVLDFKKRTQTHFLATKTILSLLSDYQGNIWMSEWQKAIWVIDSEMKQLRRIANPGFEGGFRLKEDHQHNIWLTHLSRGQFVLSVIEKDRKDYVEILDTRVSYYFQDSNHRMWLTSENGPMAISLEEKTAITINNKKEVSWMNGLFEEDRHGRLWVIKNDTIEVFSKDRTQMKKIVTNSALRWGNTIKDKRGVIWIGTSTKGILLVDSNGPLPEFLDRSDGLIDGQIRSFEEDHRGDIWLGTPSGINIYSPSSNTLKAIDQATLQTPNSDNIFVIREFEKDKFFVDGTQGFLIINRAEKLLTHYLETQKIAERIYGALKDEEGTYWLATENGFAVYNPVLNVLKTIPKGSPQLNADRVSCMLDDGTGRYWLGTDNGLAIVDPDKNTIQYLREEEGLCHNNVMDIIQREDGTLWVATDDGISIINPVSQTITNLGEAEGLVPDEVYNLQEKEGTVYIGSVDGLMLVKPPADQNTPWNFFKYSQAQGFLANDYNRSGGILLRNGQLWFGSGPKWELIILTQDPVIDTVPYPVFITGLTIMDEKRSFDRMADLRPYFETSDTLWSSDSDQLLTKNTMPQDSGYVFEHHMRWDSLSSPYKLPIGLKMPYDQNFLRFSFTNLDVLNRDKISVRYMLAGADDEWIYSGQASESKNYFNLPPGAYTFSVATKGITGQWGDPAEFSFRIFPPWWRTWWAYLGYALLAIGAVWAIVQYRSQRLQNENRLLEEKVAHRTTELSESIDHLKSTQAQLIQSEKLASLGELTAGIAHEIQNPLNFVNNFSELSVDLAEELKEEIYKLEIDGKDKEFIDELIGDLTSNQQKINHHGKRAASIVTGMLQHARTSTGTKEPTDLNALADEYLRLSYHGLRAKDSTFNAKMITDFDPSIGKVEVVPQDIGRVFLNIISNAFYATQVGATLAVAHGGDRKGRPYEPTVSVSSKKEKDHVVFKIKDNGTGIPDDVKAKIFQPFFTTKPTGQGTGLGLSLAYDIISKGHGGNLEVETKTGEGTEFIIILPTS